MMITRPEYIIKQSNAIWSITKMLGEAGECLDGYELEGIRGAIFNTLRELDKASHDLIPCVEDDTLEDINRKLSNAFLVVERIEEAKKILEEKKG